MAGRGFGKTRTGAQWIQKRAEQGIARHIALVSQRAADARDVMVEGESGILACAPPWFKPIYESSKRRLTWPNGAMATCFSDEEPNQLRGPQHDSAWVDELAKFDNASRTWDNLELGLRLGENPQCIVTTTPQPIPVIRELVKDQATKITTGSTYENIHNLAPTYIDRVIKKYEGTRLGKQELHAILLENVEGALWNHELLEKAYLSRLSAGLQLIRFVVAVDPSASEGGNEAGIMAGALGNDGHVYVMGDHSLKASPEGWASKAIAAYHGTRADKIVAEINNGGAMVEAVIKAADPNVPVKTLWASRGKVTRAEPVVLLYEQGMVHHVGEFSELEDQLCTWVPGMPSPDRLDALVWLVTELKLEAAPPPRFAAGGRRIIRSTYGRFSVN